MVSVKFDYRILTDKYFIEWLSKDKSNRGKILRKLMFVKSSSEENKKCHNIIEYSDAKECIHKNIIKDSTLGGAFKTYPLPYKFIKIKCGYTKIIQFAISLCYDKPYRCYIFTSSEKVEEYEKNPHYAVIKSVVVKGGNDAIAIINKYFDDFERIRQLQR